MNIQLVIATAVTAAVAATSFGSAWQIQSWRYAAKEAQHEKQKLADVQQSAAATIRRADNVIAAQDAAQTRARGLRVDAAGARDALVSLHDAAASALQAASATHAACVERANALSVALGTMADAGGEVAAQADRHASDAKTLMDAWPR